MIHPDLPERALSIQQPWSWLIVNRHKNIENRDWLTRFRGPVAIHAGKMVDRDAASDVMSSVHPVTGLTRNFHARPGCFATGAIVGIADLVDCVERSDSDWFVGRYGFILANQRPVPPIKVKGELGFFNWRKNL